MQPIDSAWNVAKGEAFHPSVAGYMAAGQGGERDQAILEEMRRMEEIYGTMPLHGMAALEFHNKYMELENSLSDDPHALQNMRAARPRVERENRPSVLTGYTDHYGRPAVFLNRPSTNNMPHERMSSGKRNALKLQMYNAGRGKPVGPTGELDTLAHVSDEPIGFDRTDTQIISDMHDKEQEARLPEMGSTIRPEPMLQRSFDSPIDTAWSVLKALSREDLEMASRTGGIERLGLDTMRPEISSMNMGAIAPLTQVLPNEPRFSGPRTEQADIQQEYNEAMFPDEEAEHQRINAPTPLRAPVMRVNRKTRERFMVPGAPMPVGEAGEASMDDPSQMEHLGRELADAHHEDIDPTADIPLQLKPPNFRTLQARAPNRHALSEMGSNLNLEQKIDSLMSRLMNGETLTTEELRTLQNAPESMFRESD